MDFTRIAFQAARVSKKLGLDWRAVYRILVLAAAPDTERSLAELRRRRLFLIVSTGRTGTRWLARLLNEIPDALVMHEPMPEEHYDNIAAILRPETSPVYVRTYRVREMALRVRAHNPGIYGEVNGALRRHVTAFRDLFPRATIIHLVRDGRDVVRSIVNRPAFTPGDRISGDFRPPSEDLDPAAWDAMDRFSRICWFWAYENAYLRRHVAHRARFEDMLGSYELFKQQILDPLELQLDAALWQARVRRPDNITRNRDVAFGDWTGGQKDAFQSLCGEEMQHYGYG